ncbi:hypothetical protein [Streptomyces sp. NBC_00078]|uniref:hypothetical protein n=1 Tax=unclassified Streptomyces TaxID=2593676 RepID=UPI002251EA14|nr:hypothetical protein [Streptomyces sp. NBC_00078]MCX5422840.1 hypothetical protein [Streptomyces sp. NBC_00078]
MRSAVAAVVTAAVLAGAYAWFTHTPAARLGKACGGALPVDDMLAMTGASARFGGQDLKLATWHYDEAVVSEPDGLSVACTANDIEIHIETAVGNRFPFGNYTFQSRDDVLPIPLRDGWSGFLVAESEDNLGASVLLNCANWKPSHGSGLLVTADADGVDSASTPARARLARIVTQTAKKAAEQTGCTANPGRTITEIDSQSTTSRTGAEKADGTCAGTRSQSSVRESAARTAPVEYCVLGGRLWLRAFYGPFARIGEDGGRGDFDKPFGNEGYAVWGTAACPGAEARALYTAMPLVESDRRLDSQPLTARELEDLKQFAERSAARHHCSAAALPGTEGSAHDGKSGSRSRSPQAAGLD